MHEQKLSTRKLFGKFLLVQMPVFALALLLGISVLTRIFSRDEVNQLNARVGNLSARVAALLAQSHVQSDPRQAETYLALLLADTAVRCAELVDSGRIVASAPRKIGCKGQSEYLDLEVPLPVARKQTIRLKYTTAELAVVNASKQRFNYLAMIMSLLLATLAGWVAFRLIVGKPVATLLGAIRRSARSGRAVRVTDRPSDELGTVIDAFNSMQERLAAEAERNMSALSHLQHIYKETPGLMFSMSAAGSITNASGYWLDTMGYARAEVIGLPLAQFIYTPPGSPPADVAKLLGHDIEDLALSLITRPGRVIEVLLSAKHHADPTGNNNDYLCVMTDVTNLNAANRKLRKQAATDHLTGLPNRQGLFEFFDALKREGKDALDGLTMLFIDLDNFKWVNDTHGHEAGDLLLQEVARRIAQKIGAGDYLARLGGDEFAVILRDPESLADAKLAAERVLAAMLTPFHVWQITAHIGCSIGVAGPLSSSSDLAGLLRFADLAMYKSKQDGRSKVTIYTTDLEAASASRARSVVHVRAALDRQQLRLHYQPIICLDSLTPCGAEALLRVEANGVTISPAEFIQAAEDAGLMGQVGDFILETGFAAGQSLTSGHVALKHMSINLSPRQLEPSFTGKLLARLRAQPDLAARLMLEITETALLNYDEKISAFFNDVRALGARIALDDFGTGYSPLSHLAQYPIDVIKLDRSFISNIDDPLVPGARRNYALIKSASTLCQELNILMIAEGIETMGEMTVVKSLGIKLGQGFLFSRALPESAFRQWISQFDRRHLPGPALSLASSL